MNKFKNAMEYDHELICPWINSSWTNGSTERQVHEELKIIRIMLSERGFNINQRPSLLSAIKIGLKSTGENPPLNMTSIGGKTTANLVFLNGNRTFHY